MVDVKIPQEHINEGGVEYTSPQSCFPGGPSRVHPAPLLARPDGWDCAAALEQDSPFLTRSGNSIIFPDPV